MASILQFSRNTKAYLQMGTDVWELPILDGFSFSQATNASEITLNEAANSAGVSRRARQMFTDSYAPAEWSFTTYIRPNGGADGAAGLGCIEEALWANMIASGQAYTDTTGAFTLGVDKSTANTTVFDFTNSNKTTLNTFTLWMVLGACGTDPTVASFSEAQGQTVYKISNAVINSAAIDFDIDGIAQITWSGFGSLVEDKTDIAEGSGGWPDVTGGGSTTLVTTGIDSTSNFIRNRLTSLSVVGDLGGGSTTYSLVLTGGSLSFENNLTFLTPETLCSVNQPLGHITGSRSISGSFTCYLDAEGDSSAQLFQDVLSANTLVTNEMALTFGIGGASAPSCSVTMPRCHLEVPSHSIEDVISVETAFHALPSSLDEADEATVTYLGTA